MKSTIFRKVTAFILSAAATLALAIPSTAASDVDLDKAVSAAAAFMLKKVKAPEVGSTGGEWAVIGLARSGYSVPDSYYRDYYSAVEKYVKKEKGVLHDKKYTEYSRVILGLTAAGFDPRDVAGYDLTVALGDFDRTIWQGVNGPIFALLALDSMGYAIPKNPDAKTQATRELYVDEILRRQTPDGGWNLTAGSGGKVGANEKGDPDLTGMALQALAQYQDDPDVKTATDKALAFLSGLQDAQGGYTGWNSVNSESVVQVLTALCELGVPVNDKRFVKNGKTLVDNLLSFKLADGSFSHTAEGDGDSQMSSEQAFYGLVAAQRARDGKNSLYDMTDTVKRGNFKPIPTEPGLKGKHRDISLVPVTSPGKTFSDIKNHANKAAIEALAERKIISGKTSDEFDPNATMTRAEFATIVTRALALPEHAANPFTDVPASIWYSGYVATAYYYELISGSSATTFNPEGKITRQDAAVLLARAAKLCGMDTARVEVEIRDTLAQFGDYRTAGDWARSQLAFCYSEGIFDDSALDIKPQEPIKRCEIAEALYRLLDRAALLGNAA